MIQLLIENGVEQLPSGTATVHSSCRFASLLPSGVSRLRLYHSMWSLAEFGRLAAKDEQQALPAQIPFVTLLSPWGQCHGCSQRVSALNVSATASTSDAFSALGVKYPHLPCLLLTSPSVCLSCCRTVAAIANDPDFHLNLKLQPGDIEIIHNPSTFHSRTKVVDGEVRTTTAIQLQPPDACML